MAESKEQPTENKEVSDIPVGPLKSATKGNFTVMAMDSKEYQTESAARKNRNREAELKALDPQTRANIEAANAQGKGVMWKKPDGSSYLFTAQKPNEKTTENDKKKEEEKGAWAWCKRNWGWLLAGAVALGVGAYFLIRNKNKKKDKNKTAVQSNKKSLGTNSSTQINNNTSNSGTSNSGTSNSGTSNSGTSNSGTKTGTNIGNTSLNDSNNSLSGSKLKEKLGASSAGTYSETAEVDIQQWGNSLGGRL